MLEVRLLGTFDVRHNSESISIPSRPAQSLFAYLILHAGASHRREKLAGMLWPDSLEETARDNLRHALWRLRKAFPPALAFQYLLADDLSIAFNGSSEYWFDAAALEQLDEDAPADEVIKAISEYRGELLPGFYEEWVALEREHLHSVFEHRMAQLMSLLQEEKRWLDVMEWGERWIRLGQKPELAYRALMTAHAAKGDLSKVAAIYERCVKSLKELGIEPAEQTRVLYRKLKAGQVILETAPAIPAQAQEEPPPKTNLPVPLTSFVGREREVDEVTRLLSTARLVTLTGPGGIGKTRLSIQSGQRLIRSYTDGVWWVELASLNDGQLVLHALAQVLGVRESPKATLIESIKGFLQGRQLVLILDNCEHILPACAELAHNLLSHCAQLRILATSREALMITGEVIFHVPGLSFPVLSNLTQLQTLREFESIQLFAERAAAIRPDLELTRENVFAVAQICQRLDGIPLALELAAARVRLLTLEELARRLDDRFSLLTQGSRTAMPRHQTLRATIDWSYELLPEPERILLRRLSVFAGGFTLRAAEAVATGEGLARFQVMDLLESLIAKSLVTLGGQTNSVDGETRYRMLETIRAYAREKLEESGEEQNVRERHLMFYAAFAETAQRGIYSTEQAAWFRRLEQDVDNLRSALDWQAPSPQPGHRSALQNQYVIISSLSLFWERGYRTEIVEALRKLLDRDAGNEPVPEKVRALDVGGFLLWSQNRLSEARAFLEQSIQIAEQLQDDSLLVWPLMYLGWTFWGLEGYEDARKSLERSLAIARTLGENGKGAVAVAMAYLADIPYAQGNLPQARNQYEEAIALLRTLQNPSMLGPTLRRLAYVELREGKFRAATALFQESLEANLRLGHQPGTAACLAGFAAVHLAMGNSEKAAILCGSIESLLEHSGNSLLFTDMVEYERLVALLRQQLEEGVFSAARAKGAALTLEQAIDFAWPEEKQA